MLEQSVGASHDTSLVLLCSGFFARVSKIEDPWSEHRVVALWGMILTHSIKSALALKPVVNEGPGAFSSVANLAHAVVGTTTGPVEKSLVTGSNRTDPSSVCQNAFSTLHADL